MRLHQRSRQDKKKGNANARNRRIQALNDAKKSQIPDIPLTNPSVVSVLTTTSIPNVVEGDCVHPDKASKIHARVKLVTISEESPIRFYEKLKVFTLTTTKTLYAMRVTEQGYIENLYYGARMEDLGDCVASALLMMSVHEKNVLNLMDSCEDAILGKNGEAVIYVPKSPGNNSLMTDFSCSADDYKRHTVTVRPFPSANLTYKSHRIVEGKQWIEPRGDFAQVRVSKGDFANTLIITLSDGGDMEVDLHYTVFPHEDAIVRRTVVRNAGASGKMRVHSLASITLDLESAPKWSLTRLAGAWGREGQRVTQQLEQGSIVYGSTRRGTCSHAHQPFAILSEGDQGYNEFSGCHYGALLIYTGNFEFHCESTDVGRVRLTAGMQSDNVTAWPLRPGEEHTSPECILTYSDSGVNTVSHNLHAIITNHVLPPEFRSVKSPLLVNTWEAMYFDMTLPKIRALAKDAYKLGAELLVVDDGWFENRPTDTSGLGDWIPDLEKLGPEGIANIYKILEEERPDSSTPLMKLGMWLEPEMCNEDSNVFREHPDWIVHNDRTAHHHMRRHQFYLDLTKPEVQEHILGCFRRLLSDSNAPVSYIKWDLNRNMTETPDFSSHVVDGLEKPFFHMYTLGLWKVLGTIRKEFPHVLIESCGAGGGRLDPGMLYFCPQSWASDNTDPVCRAKIALSGLSLCYPTRCMGAHVSANNNHQTYRTSSIRMQTAVNMVGTGGFELDLGHMSEEEFAEAQLSAQVMKKVANGPLFLEGKFWRIWDPASSRKCDNFGGEVFAYCLSSPCLSSLLVSFALTDLSAVGRCPPKLKLPAGSVDENRMYRITEAMPSGWQRCISTMQMHKLPIPKPRLGTDVVIPGSMLVKAGIPTWWCVDGDCLILRLQAV